MNVVGFHKDKDEENNNVHPPRYAKNIDIMESCYIYLHKTKNVMSILLHDEGMIKQPKKMTIVHEFNNLSAPHEPHHQRGQPGELEGFQECIQLHERLHEEGEDFMKSKRGKEGKDQAFPKHIGVTQIRMKANDHISFVLLDFGNIPKNLFKGIMDTLLYKPFLAKFVEYVGSMMKHPNVWLWIVEDIRAEHVYEIMS